MLYQFVSNSRSSTKTRHDATDTTTSSGTSATYSTRTTRQSDRGSVCLRRGPGPLGVSSPCTSRSSRTDTCRTKPWMDQDLSNTGYLLCLQDVITGAVLAVVDQSHLDVKADFARIETINVDVDRCAYFQTTANTQRAVASDLLDTKLLVRLRALHQPRFDCNALVTAYPAPKVNKVEWIPTPVHAPKF